MNNFKKFHEIKWQSPILLIAIFKCIYLSKFVIQRIYHKKKYHHNAIIKLFATHLVSILFSYHLCISASNDVNGNFCAMGGLFLHQFWVNSILNSFSYSTFFSQSIPPLVYILYACTFINMSLVAWEFSISLSWTFMNLAISSCLQSCNEKCKKIIRTSIPKTDQLKGEIKTRVWIINNTKKST